MGNIVSAKNITENTNHLSIDLSKHDIPEKKSFDSNTIETYIKSIELASRYNFSIKIEHDKIILLKLNKQIGSFNTISNLFFFLKGYQFATH